MDSDPEHEASPIKALTFLMEGEIADHKTFSSSSGLKLVVKEDRRWLAGRKAGRREKSGSLKD